MKKLAIIHTHPVQYNAPWFKLLAERNNIKIKVFYTWEESKDKFYDSRFKQEIIWDIPLLEGYEYEFVPNISKLQSSQSFYGIQNPDLIPRIEKWNADAILIFGWKFKSHLQAMRYFKGKIPVYFRGDSTLLDEKKTAKDKLRRVLLKNIYKNIDYAFYVGKQNKSYFMSSGLKEEQLIFVPHAIDNQRFEDNENEFKQKAINWRKKLGLKSSDTVFLFVGKFESKKNPTLLIEAIEKINKPNAKLVFVGNGEWLESLKQKSENLSNIYFLPFQNQSQMPIVYRLGDVFVLPSSGPGETWGLSVNEAMACGLPVIASNKVGCAIDLINENGFCFHSGNSNELAEKMNYFIEKPELKSKLGQNSLNLIQSWNFKAICQNIENSLLSV